MMQSRLAFDCDPNTVPTKISSETSFFFLCFSLNLSYLLPFSLFPAMRDWSCGVYVTIPRIQALCPYFLPYQQDLTDDSYPTQTHPHCLFLLIRSTVSSNYSPSFSTMTFFSLEHCSNRAILLLQTTISFFLSSVLPLFSSSHSMSPTGSSRPPRFSFIQAIKDSLRVFTYAEVCQLEDNQDHESVEGGESGGGSTCAVCLNEMKMRDEVRELRNCRHLFHRRCLDQWLDHDENGTCPLCRAPLLATSGTCVPPPANPSWAVERLLYLFGDDIFVIYTGRT